MTQDEVKQLTDAELCRLSQDAANYWAISKLEEIDLYAITRMRWNPIISTEQAIYLAALMNMNICFGDSVVLVSEPAGYQSRSVAYDESGVASRMVAMRRAVTLLAADSAQYI